LLTEKQTKHRIFLALCIKLQPEAFHRER